MADQILSKEEIDALLSAMDKGEVDLEPESGNQGEVERYNLASRIPMLGSRFSGLEPVCDKFATLVGQYLTATFQRPIEVSFASTDMIRFGEFITTFSNPTSLNTFTMEPLIGASLMAIEPALVFALIDCMFGGPGRPLKDIREFTLIEQRMMKQFVEKLLRRFEDAWKEIHPVSIRLQKTETKPEYAHPVGPNELMIVVMFTLKGPEFSGNLHVGLPSLMLEPIKDKLCVKDDVDKEPPRSWSKPIRTLLLDTRVNVAAELGKTVLTIRDILSLKVDDVVRLDTGPEDPIVVTVDDVPKFQGYPGVVKGNRAVEIHKRTP